MNTLKFVCAFVVHVALCGSSLEVDTGLTLSQINDFLSTSRLRYNGNVDKRWKRFADNRKAGQALSSSGYYVPRRSKRSGWIEEDIMARATETPRESTTPTTTPSEPPPLVTKQTNKPITQAPETTTANSNFPKIKFPTFPKFPKIRFPWGGRRISWR